MNNISSGPCLHFSSSITAIQAARAKPSSAPRLESCDDQIQLPSTIFISIGSVSYLWVDVAVRLGTISVCPYKQTIGAFSSSLQLAGILAKMLLASST